MLAIVSPTKSFRSTLLERSPIESYPEFIDESQTLAAMLQRYSVTELQKLMRVSPQIAYLNQERYLLWDSPDVEMHSALFGFTGQTYIGLDPQTLTPDLLELADSRLRILSGLYGVLKPNDLIKPYRLEMGLKFKDEEITTLYKFWGDKVTDSLNRTIEEHGHKYVVNTTSNEYFKVINSKKLVCPVVTPVFMDKRDDGSYKMLMVYAKRARGLMARYMLENICTKPEDLYGFSSDGYFYNEELSKEKSDVIVFTRG